MVCFGGDEFGIFVEGLVLFEFVVIIGDKLLFCLCELVEVDGWCFCVIVSIGVVVYLYNGVMVDMLFEYVDMVMFDCK